MSNTIKIVIAGYGPVGIAVEAALATHPHVETFIDDPFLGHEYDPSIGDPVDGVVICVATPSASDGFCDCSNVDAVFEKYGFETRFLVKSAVDPIYIADFSPRGMTTISPEFLRGTTGADPTAEFLNQEFAIYGGGQMRWWHEIFKPCLPKLKNVRFLSAPQAAFAKYVENAFLATKVSFFNQMQMIYTAMQFEDFDVMVEAITIDPRIGISHTQVPGPDGKYGYGGHCFPKDVSAIAESGEACGADVSFLRNLQEFNALIRDED